MNTRSKSLSGKLCIFLACFFSWEPSFAFPTQDNLTLGIQALRYKRKSHYWFRFDSGGVDSRTTTSPPDSVYLDRSIDTFVIAGGEAALKGGQIGFRTNLKANSLVRKGEEEEPPKTPREHKKTTASLSADFTYVNHKGLELIVGLESLSVLQETSKVSSSAADSVITYSPVHLFAGRAGLVKRGSSWSGGFYYGHWKDSTRSFTKESTDGSDQEGISHVLIPSRYGIVGEFAAGSVQFEFDLGSVQAGDGGERTTNGNLVRDDYLRIFFGMYYPFSGSLGLKTELAHQTLSYADNAYASVDTIPVTSLRSGLIMGNNDSYGFIGFVAGYGTGGTDITEYKARFSTQAVALSLALFSAL